MRERIGHNIPAQHDMRRSSQYMQPDNAVQMSERALNLRSRLAAEPERTKRLPLLAGLEALGVANEDELRELRDIDMS